ncbi:MAG TPA: Crp/Fnr family transcriptional regulator [Puia sp.]|jgi:CRP-like cAMP-binding protein|nr:Crp/Fnr family transcriptional regulator [Puia sp.]
MTDLAQFCTRFSPLDENALADLLQASSTQSYKQGQPLLRKNQTCRHLFFINEGLLKLSSTDPHSGKQFVMRFFAEDTFFSAFDSYNTQTPSKFTLLTLEDSIVTTIGYADMERLCGERHSIETLFRKLLSVATTKMTRRINEMLESDATKRYNQFIQENDAILQRISLGDIADYLGITRQSLSRIRAGHGNLP